MWKYVDYRTILHSQGRSDRISSSGLVRINHFYSSTTLKFWQNYRLLRGRIWPAVDLHSRQTTYSAEHTSILDAFRLGRGWSDRPAIFCGFKNSTISECQQNLHLVSRSQIRAFQKLRKWGTVFRNINIPHSLPSFLCFYMFETRRTRFVQLFWTITSMRCKKE